MTTTEEVEALIADGLSVLDYNRHVSQADKEERASFLLILCADLAGYKRKLEKQYVAYKSVERAALHVAMQNSGMKTAQDKKTAAEADPNYIKAKADMLETETEINYIDAHIDIFNNGHVMYRQFAKEIRQVATVKQLKVSKTINETTYTRRELELELIRELELEVSSTCSMCDFVLEAANNYIGKISDEKLINLVKDHLNIYNYDQEDDDTKDYWILKGQLNV